ncbi:Hypothetical predicted protein [Podarcis lilfordi]|uniref:Uncharacterized protein n=1 Tax=Podarcis lilfordi TaxID=74358 RepID=A0AA35PIQ8_9SAUR|nr:Hypothetical predicted protein [Podarcis lilfordi]
MVRKKRITTKILNKFPFNLFDHSTLRSYELLKFDNKYSIQLIMLGGRKVNFVYSASCTSIRYKGTDNAVRKTTT